VAGNARKCADCSLIVIVSLTVTEIEMKLVILVKMYAVSPGPTVGRLLYATTRLTVRRVVGRGTRPTVGRLLYTTTRPTVRSLMLTLTLT